MMLQAKLLGQSCFKILRYWIVFLNRHVIFLLHNKQCMNSFSFYFPMGKYYILYEYGLHWIMSRIYHLVNNLICKISVFLLKEYICSTKFLMIKIYSSAQLSIHVVGTIASCLSLHGNIIYHKSELLSWCIRYLCHCFLLCILHMARLVW